MLCEQGYLLEYVLEEVVVVAHQFKPNNVRLRFIRLSLNISHHQLELKVFAGGNVLVDHLDDAGIDDFHFNWAFSFVYFGILTAAVAGVLLHNLIQIFSVHLFKIFSLNL